MTETPRPHSAAYMGPERDLFWNRDHIELIGRRPGLGRACSVLDVGCGQGHWGRLLDTVTSPQATTLGVDFEPDWVAEAARQAQAAGLTDRFSYAQGSADALAFDDASFDLATCQTLLIHVPDPAVVIAEMLRVTKPGGLVVAAEPNNRAGLLVELAPTDDYASDVPAKRLEFYLTCARGKVALGQGDNAIGDRLPGYFANAGIVSVQVFLADKTWPSYRRTRPRSSSRSAGCCSRRHGTEHGLAGRGRKLVASSSPAAAPSPLSKPDGRCAGTRLAPSAPRSNNTRSTPQAVASTTSSPAHARNSRG